MALGVAPGLDHHTLLSAGAWRGPVVLAGQGSPVGCFPGPGVGVEEAEGGLQGVQGQSGLHVKLSLPHMVYYCPSKKLC